MCGLVGIVSLKENNSQLVNQIKLMNNFLSHRGPDDEGYYFHNNVALGHKRLSILDLSKKGSQPMIDPETKNVLVFNGEIYNFLDLKISLEKKGEIFFSNSDTEVILKLYKLFGLEGLKKCEGMFSFALFDKKKDVFYIFRDRLGIKPLFFFKDENFFAFSSEIKSLVHLLDSKDLNYQAFSEYLFYGNSFKDNTIFERIKSLEPGGLIIFNNSTKKFSSHQWWKVEDWIYEDYPDSINKKDNHLEEILQKNIDEAVQRQLNSDVPVGIFLSGGIDSSTVAASIRNTSSRKIKSFVATFDFEQGINEKNKSFQVANYLNLDHEELNISGENLIHTIEKLAHFYDEPFGDAANIPLYLMTKEAKKSIKVVLSGDGGDELFSGYPRNKIISNLDILRLVPNLKFMPNKLFNRLSFVRIKRISQAINSNNYGEVMAQLLTTEILKKNPFSLFEEEKEKYLRETTNPFKSFLECNERFKKFSNSKKMMLTDLTLQLPSQFLTKVDRASMANSIEIRVPLLDEKILKFALNLSDKKIFSRFKDKIILRNILKKRISRRIVAQKKKGFGVPYEFWLKTSLYDYAFAKLTDDNFLNYFNLEQKKIETLLIQHKKGISDRGFMLWKLLQLSLWQDKYLN